MRTISTANTIDEFKKKYNAAIELFGYGEFDLVFGGYFLRSDGVTVGQSLLAQFDVVSIGKKWITLQDSIGKIKIQFAERTWIDFVI